jgi:hypothetical protein
MYQDLSKLYGKKLGATDGTIGAVKDFYFDDQSWAIRYLVADTGPWLAERQVLLSPHAFARQALARADGDTDVLQVTLTRKQIEDSPSIETHRPVSRQYEEEYYRHFGWPTYWEGGGMWGAAGFPTLTVPEPPELQLHHGHNQRDDLHLRSTKSIAGYRVQATDGPVGSVTGFKVEGWSWGIRELVVETGHWYSGKPILVLPGNIERISYEDSTVYVNLTTEDIEDTAKNDIAQAVVGHR